MEADTVRDRTLRTRLSVETLIHAAQEIAVDEYMDHSDKDMVLSYLKYLLGEKPRSYQALAEFLEWYGLSYILGEVIDILEGWRFSHIYELGPGTGWLIRALSPYTTGDLIAIDKRSVLFQRSIGIKFLQKDLEDYAAEVFLPNGSDPTQTLVVANQFLHCVKNRSRLIRKNRAVWMVVEVDSVVWRKQIRAFGGEELSPSQLMKLFEDEGYVLTQKRRSSLLSVTLWTPR